MVLSIEFRVAVEGGHRFIKQVSPKKSESCGYRTVWYFYFFFKLERILSFFNI